MLKSVEKFNQPVLFDGMKYNTNGTVLTPISDLDAITDCCGHAWIIFESKLAGSPITRGQKILLENIINDLSKADKPAAAFLCYHSIKDPDKPIYLKDSIVAAVYSVGKGWQIAGRDYKTKFTVKELTDIFLSKYAPDMLRLSD